ncbi:3-dehydroquinate synthase family protein, partial [Hungatella sp.]|uniref:3-dehydroquinate synthase n=1 Tax=Hungatella sp. TaxID=2613924 RepID=UPI002A7EF038
YLRGISFIQVPTTLLSQVDSSIGGKTGVDFDAYKNMVGAFHMPKLVYTNISTLKTLTDEQFSSGMGEIIKHGLIKDAAYYEWLGEHGEAIGRRDLSVCEEMVLVSNRIKRDVVEMDPTEQGERALLNYGHTLGHAIEKLADFKLMHGHCVGLGCIAAMGISAARGTMAEEELLRLKEMMERFGMPLTVSGLSADEIIETTKSDKKMDSGTIRFILLEKAGKAYIDKTVTDDEMNAGLSRILA